MLVLLYRTAITIILFSGIECIEDACLNGGEFHALTVPSSLQSGRPCSEGFTPAGRSCLTKKSLNYERTKGVDDLCSQYNTNWRTVVLAENNEKVLDVRTFLNIPKNAVVDREVSVPIFNVTFYGCVRSSEISQSDVCFIRYSKKGSDNFRFAILDFREYNETLESTKSYVCEMDPYPASPVIPYMCGCQDRFSGFNCERESQDTRIIDVFTNRGITAKPIYTPYITKIKGIQEQQMHPPLSCEGGKLLSIEYLKIYNNYETCLSWNALNQAQISCQGKTKCDLIHFLPLLEGAPECLMKGNINMFARASCLNESEFQDCPANSILVKDGNMTCVTVSKDIVTNCPDGETICRKIGGTLAVNTSRINYEVKKELGKENATLLFTTGDKWSKGPACYISSNSANSVTIDDILKDTGNNDYHAVCALPPQGKRMLIIEEQAMQVLKNVQNKINKQNFTCQDLREAVNASKDLIKSSVQCKTSNCTHVVLDNVLHTLDILLSEGATNAWKDIEHLEKRRIVGDVMQAVDDIAFQYGRNMETSTKNKIERNINIVFQVRVLIRKEVPKQLVFVDDVIINKKKGYSSITICTDAIPRDLADNMTSIVFTSFRDVRQIITSPYNVDLRKDLKLITPVIGAAVGMGLLTGDEKSSSLRSEQPVATIKLFHLEPLDTGVSRNCYFWNNTIDDWRSEGCRVIDHQSTVSYTVCECNQLTKFAVFTTSYYYEDESKLRIQEKARAGLLNVQNKISNHNFTSKDLRSAIVDTADLMRNSSTCKTANCTNNVLIDALQTIDVTLSENATDAWKAIPEVERRGLIGDIMDAIDYIAYSFGSMMESNSTVRIQNNRNIALKVEVFSKNQYPKSNLYYDVISSTSGKKSRITISSDVIFRYVTANKTASAITSLQDVRRIVNGGRCAQLKLISPVIGVAVDVNAPIRSEGTVVTIELFHHETLDPGSARNCYFWNKSLHDWDTEGCKVILDKSSDNYTTCECNHLTNFAVLTGISDYDFCVHSQYLKLISIIGSIVSISCLILCLITLRLRKSRKDWRISTELHFNLCLCLLLGHVVFLLGLDRTEWSIPCKVISIFLQFIFLAAITWMMLEGVHLYILTVKDVIHGGRTNVVIYYILGYSLPGLVTSGSVVYGLDGYGIDTGESLLYRRDGYNSYGKHCWLSPDINLYFFNIPASAAIMVNIILLALALIAMSNSDQFRQKMKQRDEKFINRCRNMAKRALILSPLLGVTWLLGFVLKDHNISIYFTYLFTILTAPQGFFIFLFLCWSDRNIRHKMHQLLHKLKISHYKQVYDIADQNKFIRTPENNLPENRTDAEQAFEDIERTSSGAELLSYVNKKTKRPYNPTGLANLDYANKL